MPQYRVQVFKRIGANGKEWSNVYHVLAASLVAAEGFVNTIVGAEASVHKANVQFVRARTSSEVPGDNQFVTTSLLFFGAVPIGSGQLPLFNTVRVDFNVAGGRPSYKYLRVPIEELDTNDGILAPGFVGEIETNYAAPLVGISDPTPGGAGLVDESGNAFTSATINTLIQERQLRRRRRARSSGGLSGS